MTPGTTVMIYEDPITQLKPEGKARLIERHERDDRVVEVGACEFWKVRFMDGMECNRWIKIKEEN